MQSLSGTGALRIFAEFYALLNGRGSKLLIPNPTWGNHVSIFQRAGLTPVQYRYYNNTQSELDYNGLLEDIDKADTGSLILLHACAHNPTGNYKADDFFYNFLITSSHTFHILSGCDPSKDQWKELSQHIKRKNHNVLFDMAYQVRTKHALSNHLIFKPYPLHCYLRQTLLVLFLFSCSCYFHYRYRRGSVADVPRQMRMLYDSSFEMDIVLVSVSLIPRWALLACTDNMDCHNSSAVQCSTAQLHFFYSIELFFSYPTEFWIVW